MNKLVAIIEVLYEEDKERKNIFRRVEPLWTVQRRDGSITVTFQEHEIARWIRKQAEFLIRQGLYPRPDPEMLQSINIIGSDAVERDIVQEISTETARDVTSEVTVETPAGAIKEQHAAMAPIMQKEKVPDFDESAIHVLSREQRKGGKVRLKVRKEALDLAKKHAKEDPSLETGGVLLGTYLEENDDITVVITGIVRALKAVRETSAVNFTPETWAEIWRCIDQHPIYSDEKIWTMVGWYHTHPGFGIFLSGMDLFIHQEYFTHRGHTALVIDPINKTNGFFCWDAQGQNIDRVQDSAIEIVDDRKLLNWLKAGGRLQKKKLPPVEIKNDCFAKAKSEIAGDAPRVESQVSEPDEEVPNGKRRKRPTDHG